jgi:hypothetical protein
MTIKKLVDDIEIEIISIDFKIVEDAENVKKFCMFCEILQKCKI